MTRGDLYGNVSIHKFDLFWIKCEAEWSVQVVTYGTLSGPGGRLGRRRQSHKLESWWATPGASNSGIQEGVAAVLPWSLLPGLPVQVFPVLDACSLVL